MLYYLLYYQPLVYLVFDVRALRQSLTAFPFFLNKSLNISFTASTDNAKFYYFLILTSFFSD